MENSITWTESQKRRLKELGADSETLLRKFSAAGDRNDEFLLLEKAYVQEHRKSLEKKRREDKRPELSLLREALATALTAEGFTEVITPTIMSRSLLEKMGITGDHPLIRQIFWLDDDRCMRPMLAPHLYYILVDLLRLWEKPVRIFEVGPCYRKETSGARHAGEFTMLNLVEMGLPLEEREQRLREFADLAVSAAGIKDYQLEGESSAVYGETIDLVAGEGDVEIGSAALGPHKLDQNWRIDTAWVGIGLGLERMLMVKHGGNSITPWKRSLSYLDGARLRV